jgi:hypothetical protein
MADIDHLIMATSARIERRAADSSLLTAASGFAPDPAVFEQFPPFFWRSEISSDRLDAYYTVMDPATTLPNYAKDAAEGRAVLIGHNTRELPIGYSLTGVLEQDGDVTRVLSDAYALTDDSSAAVVNRMRAGVVRDISVGFRTDGAKCLCSICGLDMWRDWDCWHIPGFEYEMSAPGSKGSNGAKVMALATGLIVDAHLAEYSPVYDGATPGAAILQAQKAAEAGRITVSQARLIESRYRINLPGKRIVAPGATLSKGATMDEKELQRLLEAAGAPADLAADARAAWLATRVAELAQLAPLAEDGRQYRADLVNGAVAEAVRAFGAEGGEGKRAMLLRMDLATIKEMADSWRTIGDAKLPGGRSSTDGEAPDETFVWKKPHVGGLSRG